VQKTPRPEPEPSPVLNPKRPKETAHDAREIAKKLLKSGAIGPIKKVPNRTDQESFKRPCGMERKLLVTTQALSSYQPFSAASTGIKTEVIPDSTPKATPTTKFSVCLILKQFIVLDMLFKTSYVCRICIVVLFLPLLKQFHLLRVHQNQFPNNLLVRKSLYLLEEVVQ